MPPTNTAAWQTAAKATPLEIKPAPYTSPLPNEITIRNHAVAINPVDRVLQEKGEDLFAWIKYPTIFGIDTAGEVVEIGSNITRFKVGDRVLTGAEGITANNPAASAFQLYTVLLEDLACKIPDTLSYEQAAVLPLGLSTAACGLFPKDFLGLEHPTLSPKSTGKALLIWGGATSVGSNAIQLAVAAGYEVVTTASAKNFEYVKNLGASQVFDYISESIVDDLIDAFKGKTLAGAFDSIGINGAFQACAAVLLKTQGRKFIAACMHLPKDMPEGIEAKFIFGSLKDKDESKVIFQDFLPKALAEGKYIAAPDPVVVGKGLEAIQTAFELQKKGVSAKKLVVSL